MKKGILIILCLISVQSFAQWKSYYPEKNKKQIEKQKIKKDDFLFNNHLFTALKAKTLEDYEQALKYFQKCMKINDKITTPYYESAQINKDLGNYNLAIEQIRKAVNLEKENRWYILAYGEILFSNQDFKNAAFQYKKLLELEPGNEELYFMLSDTYIYDNDFKKAIAVYDDLEKRKGIDKMISMQKQKLYMQLHKKKEAIRELIALLAAYPQDIEAMEILSELYLLNDEKDKAFEIFKQIAILAPENGRIHLTLADYYRENGENDKSFFELKLAFQSSKLDIDTKIRILISYFQLININQQMSNQAYELSEILITTHKGDPKAHAVYADILYTDKHFQEAKEQYFIVLEQDKTKSEV